MATYIPNATQTTEPVESRTVESAALEFRTLKASINGRIAAEEAARIAGDANLQTQNNAQDERIKAIEAALFAFNDGSGMPGTVYVQRLSGTGAQTAFTLNVSVPAAALIDIFINGVYQNKDTFIISGTTLTFSEAPPAGTNNIEVVVSITLANVETDASLVSFRATDSTAVVRTAQDKLCETVSVKDFGAVGDGVTDDTAAIQAALDAATGHVYVPPGRYNLSAKLTFPSTAGVALIGEGEARQSSNPYPSVLRFSHTSAAAVQIYGSGQSLQNLVIRAIGARVSAALDAVSFGVLLEGPDTVSGSPANCSIKNVFIEGHPSHGFVSSGPTFMTSLEGVAVRDCKAHAFVISDGTVTGRTNKERPGGIIAQHLRTFKNGGHDFVCGEPNTFGPYRVHVLDTDFGSREQWIGPIDPSIKLADAGCVVHGENIVMTNCAFAGLVNGTPTYAGVQFSGRTHRYTSCRYVGVIGVAHAVENATSSTDDILFDGVYVTHNSTANPAISITGTIGNISVLSPLAAGPGVLGIENNWFPSGYERGFVLGNGRLYLNGKTVLPLQIGKTDVTAPASTDGNVFSGVYTPTLTGVTNVTSASASPCQYMRVGNVVTVSGRFAVSPTAAGATSLRSSLPIASNLGLASECSGSGAFIDMVTPARNAFANVIGDSTNDEALFQFNANTTLSNTFHFTFTYRVK